MYSKDISIQSLSSLHMRSSNAELLNQNSAGENNNLSDADFFNQVPRTG